MAEDYAISETDYRTYLLKIKKTDPDAIVVIGYPGHLIKILEQREELGMQDIPVLSTMHVQSDFVRSKTEGLMDEVYAIAPLALVKGTQAESFTQRFEDMHDQKPDFLATFGYDMAVMLKEWDGSFNDVQGINGPLEFNQYGEVEMPLAIVHAQDRALVG